MLNQKKNLKHLNQKKFYKWNKIFKNEPSNFFLSCANFTWSILEYFVPPLNHGYVNH